MRNPCPSPSPNPSRDPSQTTREGWPGTTADVPAAHTTSVAWVAPKNQGRPRPPSVERYARPGGRGSLRERFSGIESLDDVRALIGRGGGWL
jgi:hypothetical protein